MNPQPVVHQLHSNKKGHYVRDIVKYLTMGFSNHEGSPTIHVLEGAIQSAELQTLEFHPVQYYDMSMQDKVFDEQVLERSRRNLLAIHAQLHGLSFSSSMSSAASASMCPSDRTTPNSKLPASCARDGSGTTSSTRTGQHLGAHPSSDSKDQRCATLGSQSCDGHGRERSAGGTSSMALLRTPCPSEGTQQCTRAVDSMLSVQPASQLCAEGGQSQRQYEGGKQGNGRQNADRTSAFDAWSKAHGSNLPGHAEEDRCRGNLDPHDRQGVHGAEPNGVHCGRPSKGKAFPTRASTTVEPVQTPRSMAETNWDVIPGSPPPLNDLENHLTAEEKNQLVQLMIERRQAAAASTPVPEPVNLTAAYEADMA